MFLFLFLIDQKQEERLRLSSCLIIFYLSIIRKRNNRGKEKRFSYRRDPVERQLSDVCIPNWNHHYENKRSTMVELRKTMKNHSKVDHEELVIYFPLLNSRTHSDWLNPSISSQDFLKLDWSMRPEKEEKQTQIFRC